MFRVYILERGYRPKCGTNCGGRLAGEVVGGGARLQTKPGKEEQIGCWQGFGLVVGEDER